MADLFTLVGRIAVDADSANREIDSTSGRAGGLAKRFDSIGTSAVSLGKKIKHAIVAAGITKAVTSLSKASISAYANYEQLVGGVETLFGAGGLSLEEYAASVGKSVEKVQDKYNSLMSAQSAVFDNAKNAYRTAGLSANEYMETATSFAASLVSSLKGNTVEAARLTDMAVTDMADNANKMGTSIGSIQNAYQGFAKQNYTMLDNLKLGYGGTKKEMQRLLKDAQKITGQKYNIKNFDDVIEAIHVIQEEMGIAGTTAEEAANTISGSWSATKSAWENLMAGLSDSGADIDELYANLETSAGNVVKNVSKVIPALAKNVVKSVGNLLKTAGQKISDGWENTVYPAIKDKLKAKFDIDLPEWDTIKATIATKWAEVKAAFDEGGLIKAFSVLLPDWNTLSIGISDGWNNIIWPVVQKIFSTAFRVDLPSWATLVTDISNGWNNTVWPEIQNFFSATFGVELPSWATLVENISTGWNENVLSKITEALNIAFGIEMPTWETISTKVTEWWTTNDNIYSKIKSILTWTLGEFVAPTSESFSEAVKTWWTNTGQPAVTAVTQWTFGEIVLPAWSALVTDVTTWWDETCKPAIKSIATFEVGEIQLPSAEEVAEKIKTWWGKVLELVNTYSNYNPAQTYTPEELSQVDKWTIDTVAGATTPVKLQPTDDSEGNIQGEVDDYDIEGKALIKADQKSEAAIQAALNGMSLTVPVTPKLTGGVDGTHASGLDRVPFNGYHALLHKDEMVLTASQAAVYRREKGVFDGGSSRTRKASASNDQPINVTLNITGVSSNPYEIAGEVRNALELLRWQS